MNSIVYRLLLFGMVAFYFAAGVNHFLSPAFYMPLMPPYIPASRLMIFVSGGFEILFAVLLIFKKTRAWAAWGIILMLGVFFSVHIHMLEGRHTTFADIPEWGLWARLPLQFLFMYWAYLFTGERALGIRNAARSRNNLL